MWTWSRFVGWLRSRRLIFARLPGFENVTFRVCGTFLQALELCRAAGMVSLGRVALDGTKVRANASRRKAMSYARLSEKQKFLADEVSALLADADADAEDARFGKDKRGDELPPELARRESRLVKLTEARAALEAAAAARAR